MSIELTKDKEDQNYAYYFFETTIAGNLIITDKGKSRYELIIKTGYCSFNKHNKEITIDSTKTDDYFFNNMRLIAKIHARLLKMNEKNEFIEKSEIASG